MGLSFQSSPNHFHYATFFFIFLPIVSHLTRDLADNTNRNGVRERPYMRSETDLPSRIYIQCTVRFLETRSCSRGGRERLPWQQDLIWERVGGKELHTLFSYHARSLVCATVRIPRRLLHPHKEAVTGVLWRPKNPISHWVASRT